MSSRSFGCANLPSASVRLQDSVVGVLSVTLNIGIFANGGDAPYFNLVVLVAVVVLIFTLLPFVIRVLLFIVRALFDHRNGVLCLACSPPISRMKRAA